VRGGRRSLDMVLALAFVAALAGLAVLMRGEDVSGRARVVDGDTLDLGGVRIRLKGLDAPELAQLCHRGGASYRCGDVARDALRDLARPEMSCRISGEDRWRRSLAVCRVGGEDVGATLVRRGLAVAFGAYEAEERLARERRDGLWAGTFDRPAAWRRQHGIAAL
jgi:endonuclease YncB( thermonuclease family)